jgi:sensor histidine kinase YesM
MEGALFSIKPHEQVIRLKTKALKKLCCLNPCIHWLFYPAGRLHLHRRYKNADIYRMQMPLIIEKIDARPPLRIGLHLLFWLLLFGVRLYLTHVSFNVYHAFPPMAYLYITLGSTLLLAAFYYVAVYLLLPVFLAKKYLPGSFLLLLLVVLYTAADTFAEIRLIHGCDTCIAALVKYNADYAAYLNRGFINIVLTRIISLGTPLLLLFSLCIPFSIKMALQSFRSRLSSLQLAKDNLQLELNFLKAQLNPHFLFNSMNNIYGLIINGDKERSAALVARLSALLRYTLYEADRPTMPVAKEMNLIRDYVALEKVRLNETRVNFDDQMDDSQYQLAPLLMIPLIENAFKYCGDNATAFIDILLTLRNGELRLLMRNSIDAAYLPGSGGGIGLTNFKKRMELYYAGRYVYEAGVSGDIYVVNLIIRL